MFGGNGLNPWCQYDDDCNESKVQDAAPLSYDRTQIIEENTDYKFTTQQKLNAELNYLGEVLPNELTNAVKTNWSIAKYAPLLYVAAGAIVILSYTNKGGLSWSK